VAGAAEGNTPHVPSSSRIRRVAGRVRHSRWTAVVMVVVAATIGGLQLTRLPDASPLPALLGLLAFTLGKYGICPLRWHSLSASGQTRRWHTRSYAESELVGMLSPAHAGADLWRIHRLHQVGMDRPHAVVDVALDRTVGAVGLTLFSLAGGAALPDGFALAAVGIGVVVAVAGLLIRRQRPRLLESRPLPPKRHLVRAVAMSCAYQASMITLLLGTVDAVGQSVDPLALAGVFGASQLAGVIPGIHGASPRDGALVAGLVALGLPFGAALGAISLSALLRWVPALLLGGGALLLARRRPALVTGVSPA
jgi:glycosyltransferase 2 family protein